MKKLLAGSIALAALMGASARAADTPVVKTPVPNEPPFAKYSWTGFYVAIQGGALGVAWFKPAVRVFVISVSLSVGSIFV